MKSANLQSSTDPFVKKTQVALYTAIYFHCCCIGSSQVYLVRFVLMKCC